MATALSLHFGMIKDEEVLRKNKRGEVENLFWEGGTCDRITFVLLEKGDDVHDLEAIAVWIADRIFERLERYGAALEGELLEGAVVVRFLLFRGEGERNEDSKDKGFSRK